MGNVLDGRGHFVANGEEPLAEYRQRHALAGSHAERSADLVLEPLEGGTDAGLLPVQCPGGCSNAAAVGNLAKSLEEVPVDIAREDDTRIRRIRYRFRLAHLKECSAQIR